MRCKLQVKFLIILINIFGQNESKPSKSSWSNCCLADDILTGRTETCDHHHYYYRDDNHRGLDRRPIRES